MIEVSSREELADTFAALRGRRVRLLGNGSQQHRLPPPPEGAELVRLDGLSGVQRLDADDLTCSVAPGTLRGDLHAALQEKGVWLPWRGIHAYPHTVGGEFAADLCGPLAPGAPSPRSVLLGLEGVLADGTAFKSGARVVKSVAGFDLQKLFVGSRGRLFAATLLHLKLRPRPQALQAFGDGGLEREVALARFHAFRTLSPPPMELWVGRQGGAWDVAGLLAGNARHCAGAVARLGATPGDGIEIPPLDPPGEDGEVLQGNVRPSRLSALVDALPVSADLLVNGVGQFQIELAADATDALLRRASEIGFCAEVRAGPPARRGTCTDVDPAVARLEGSIKRALDPEGMLV